LLLSRNTGVQVGAFRTTCSFLGLLILIDIVAAIVEVLLLVMHVIC
jgi:hypothetical protein